MKESVSTLAPLDSAEHNRPKPAVDKAEAGSKATGACSCSRCGLYRWYPPLMLASTLMAGVFCWMYITKPVFLSEPRDAYQDEAQPAYHEGNPTHADEDTLDSPPTAKKTRTLDPAGSGLPGDSTPEPEIVREAPPAGLPLLSSDMKPVRVQRDGPPLFQPFVIRVPASSSETETGDDEVRTEQPLVTLSNEPDEPNEEVGGEADEQPVSVESEAGAEEDYQVQASFMAEFAAASKGASARGERSNKSRPER